MKKLKFLMPLVAMTMIACSNNDWQDVTEAPSEPTAHYATMHFNGNAPSFDGNVTRADNDNDWKNNDKVYLQFGSGVYGIATYDATSGDWGIFYYGELGDATNGKCEALYFENPTEAGYVSVQIGSTTIVYADKAASYSLEDNTLTVTASLKPLTGRVRLKGQANKEYLLEGNYQMYSDYDFTRNIFTKKSQKLAMKINKDGYSDYMYLLYPIDEDGDEENIEIVLDDKESNTSFTRKVKTDVLTAGMSGYWDIPTLENAKGWAAFKFKDFTASGVTFRMIRVVGGTDDVPNSYYIGETEVTRELYYTITNGNGTIDNPQYAMNGVSYNSCEPFITKLNEKTGGNFRLPTSKEWEFAAKGGHLSQGYTYSGSNIIGDVAWYYDNSGNKVHEVKTKQPNEIGVYDMSGNIAEWTSSNNIYTWGGSYRDDARNCKTTSNSYYINDLSGIRLVCD